jgi:hypothetical protein
MSLEMDGMSLIIRDTRETGSQYERHAIHSERHVIHFGRHGFGFDGARETHVDCLQQYVQISEFCGFNVRISNQFPCRLMVMFTLCRLLNNTLRDSYRVFGVSLHAFLFKA